jgi:hypothetical protein
MQLVHSIRDEKKARSMLITLTSGCFVSNRKSTHILLTSSVMIGQLHQSENTLLRLQWEEPKRTVRLFAPREAVDAVLRLVERP